MCCVWDSLGRVWWSEIVLRVGELGMRLGECVCAVYGTVLCGIGGVRFCCVWESLLWDWGILNELCVEQFGAGFWE